MIETATEQETEQAGENFAATIQRGDIVLLYGELGAGKTAFVRGMVRGLGGSADDVSSPTFTIIQEYAAPAATLFHVDLYRLEPAEIEDLGLDDMLEAGGIAAIEWADRWPGRPRRAIEVRIQSAGEGRRHIVVNR